MDLHKYLKKNNLSAMQFSRMSKIPYATLRGYLKDTFKPSLSKAILIQEATGGEVSCVDFFGEKYQDVDIPIRKKKKPAKQHFNGYVVKL